jgi:hypothetical protein
MQTVPMTMHTLAGAVVFTPGPYPAATVAAHSRRNPRDTDASPAGARSCARMREVSHAYEHPKA